MNLIVNVSENWAIGVGGDMLVRISADLKRFKALTGGKTVVMGSATLASLPGGKPLKNRRNIVLTSRPEALPEGAEGVGSVDGLLSLLSGQPSDDIFVIGGERVYRQLLPYCRKAYITKSEITMEADRFFPNLDEAADWHIVSESETYEENGVRFRYVDYEKA